MKRIILLLAVIGVCMGCSSARSSAPDYEITSERDKDIPNLKTKTINVSTESTKEEKLRQIAAQIKDENAAYAGLTIQFHRDTQGKSAPQDTGIAVVVNSEEAANKMLPTILFTNSDRKKLLNEDDGIFVVTQADMKRAEQEIKEAGRELEKEMKQQSKEMKKKMDHGMDKLDKEVQEMQKGMNQDLKEMEKEIPKP